MKRKHLPGIIRAAVGSAVSFGIAAGRGLGTGRQQSLRALSDGTFTVGLILTGFGLLYLISSTGFFDIMSYAAHSLRVLFTPFKRPEDQLTYTDFKTMRETHRKPPVIGTLLTGICFIAVSLLLLSLYYAAA